MRKLPGSPNAKTPRCRAKFWARVSCDAQKNAALLSFDPGALAGCSAQRACAIQHLSIEMAAMSAATRKTFDQFVVNLLAANGLESL